MALIADFRAASTAGSVFPDSACAGAIAHTKIKVPMKASALALFVFVIRCENVLDVRLRLRIRWNTAVFLDCAWPRIISGNRQAQIAMETLEQASKITRPTPDILRRIVRVGNPEFC